MVILQRNGVKKKPKLRCATASAGCWNPRTGRGRLLSLSASGKGRKLLLQPLRPTLRTFLALPLAGTHQQFTIFPAFGTMKLVNGHGYRGCMNQLLSMEFLFLRFIFLLLVNDQGIPENLEFCTVLIFLAKYFHCHHQFITVYLPCERKWDTPPLGQRDPFQCH